MAYRRAGDNIEYRVESANMLVAGDQREALALYKKGLETNPPGDYDAAFCKEHCEGIEAVKRVFERTIPASI